MKMITTIATTLLGLLLLISVPLSAGIRRAEAKPLAFPEAQGFGAETIGGRGGRVIEVTNLDDINPETGKAAPGSFRAALETPGPRIVVFRVSGTIVVCEQGRMLTIQEPFITIAGQSAPGDGIALKLDPSCSRSALSIWTHDVVIRHLRIRPGTNSVVEGGSDALSIGSKNAFNIVIDHSSFSWATDENVGMGAGAHDLTIQNSIISEALYNVPRSGTYPSGGYGMLIDEGNPEGYHTGNISLHHNLFAHNWYRNPQTTIDGLIDYRNNVIYNWGLHGLRIQNLYGPTRMNVVLNHAKPGPSTSSTARTREMWALGSLDHPPFSYFVIGNIGPRRPDFSSPEANIFYCRENHPNIPDSGQDCDPAKFAVAEPFPAPWIRLDTHSTVLERVLQNVGATLPRQDAADQRVIADVRNGTGSATLANPDVVGGWPNLNSSPAPLDTDRDGMPDSWENTHGFDPADVNDGSQDADGDGYTNIEEWLNSTNPKDAEAPAPEPTPPAPTLG